MSKKLIAVASAAALAMTAFVALPAAADVAYSVSDDTLTSSSSTSAGTGTAPYTHASLDQTDAVDFAAGAATSTAVRFVITAEEGDAVSVSSAGGVKLVSALNTEAKPVNSASGVTTLSLTGNSQNLVTFYAFTTSTTAGAVSITHDGSTVKKSVRSRIGQPWNIAATIPASVATVEATASKAYVQVTDVFGNIFIKGGTSANLSDGTVTITSASITPSGNGSMATPALASTDYSATKKAFVFDLDATASGAGSVGFSIVKGADVDTDAFPAAKNTAFSVINGSSLEDQVKALTAQVAALTADYNALAKKWNKRVASKTAPKKKTALK
jgi:hypothetical protein